MKMATNCVFILVMLILPCTSVHSTYGKKKPMNGFKEYVAKPEGTIKTIKWHGHDLVDCVDVYKQPSLNHPLLKNHTIQLEPDSFPPNSLIKRNFSNSNTINVSGNEQCPKGTIPIRRPFKNELDAFRRTRRGNNSEVNEPPNIVHKHAVFSLDMDDAPVFIGVSAALSVWKPTTDYNTFSLAQLWAAFVSNNAKEVVEAGWMVYPRLFGDAEPRFFIFYTKDGYTTGCYNLLCQGFVHISHQVSLGCVLSPHSTYGGDQSELKLTIYQSPFDKHWWIRFNNIIVGYYPHELFPWLTIGGATKVDWGGEVSQWPGQGVSRNTMGSGHFPEEGSRKAAFFRDLKYEEADNKIFTPDDEDLEKVVTHPGCYGLSKLFGEDEGELDEAHFYYGGPGASAPGCKA